MNILVLGYIIRGPLGGLAWHHLQYVLSLRQLGHQVLFLEDSDDYPSCYNPLQSELSTSPTYGLAFAEDLFASFDLKDRWAYFDAHTNGWYGLSKTSVTNFCKTADVALNLSAINPLREWWANIPIRAYVDTDPVFVQVRHLLNHAAMDLAKAHTCHFSFGENIGQLDCKIPVDGLKWLPTRQPMHLPAWKMAASTFTGNWTTVMQWDSYKVGEYNGQVFGMKSRSFDEYFSLPQFFPRDQFELAIGNNTAPLNELKKEGWQIVSSLNPTKTTKNYQQYISSSKGEWSVAKHGYVVSNSGWFSERSLCYMASGKPVVVQDTGFSKTLPVGKGLMRFSTLNEAVEQINIVNNDYQVHCIKARQIVEEYFDGTKVMKSLLENIH